MASRSPVTGVGYDQSLLAAAPEVTKADKQEGYNPDLLEQGAPTRAPTSRRTPVSLPTNGRYNGSDESNGVRKAAAPAAALPLNTSSGDKPRSRKLLWIVAGVVLLVIIAIAVGVGVGVGTKKSGNNDNSAGPVIGNGSGMPGATSSVSPTKTDTTAQTATDSSGVGFTSQDGGGKPTDGTISASGVNGGGNAPTSTGKL